MSCAVSARAIRSFTHFLFHDISSFLRRSRFLETIHHMFTFEEPQVISNFFGDRHTILEGGLSEWVVLHPLVPSAPSHASFFMRYHHFWDICAFRKLYVHMSLSKDLISKFLVYKTYDIGGWSKQVSSTASAADICSFPHFVIPEISSFLKTYKCTVFRKPSGSSDPFRRYYQSAPNISSCSSFTWCPQLRLVAST